MRALAPLLLLAACGTSAPTPDGRWFGALTPAPAKPGCAASRASLILTRGAALFTPDEGTWYLEGTASPDGAIVAERTGTTGGKQPYPTRLRARWAGAQVTGTYTTPRCDFTLALTRP